MNQTLTRPSRFAPSRHLCHHRPPVPSPVALALVQSALSTPTPPAAAPAPLARKGLALSVGLTILVALVLIVLCVGVLMLRVMGRRATAGTPAGREGTVPAARHVNPWVESGRRLTESPDPNKPPRRGGDAP